MDRRDFLQGLAATAASLEILSGRAGAEMELGFPEIKGPARKGTPGPAVAVEGYILGREIRIEHAPTRWGPVSFKLIANPGAKSVMGQIQLGGTRAPGEVHFKLRLPAQMPLESVAVNGQPATLQGIHKDTVIIKPGNERRFEITGRLG